MMKKQELTPEEERLIKKRLKNLGYLKEVCVLCDKDTDSNMMFYIDGIGQLCNKCYFKVYNEK